jgi:hypothetical protein
LDPASLKAAAGYELGGEAGKAVSFGGFRLIFAENDPEVSI